MNNDDIMVQTAYELATQAHRFQFRKKSMLPYIVHPCRVASQIARLGRPILTAIAFAHDILEDCRDDERNFYRARLAALGKVYDVVDELTYTGTTKEEKDGYLSSFARKSTEAYIIKLFDRVDNIEDFSSFGDPKYAAIYAKKAKILVELWYSHMGNNAFNYLGDVATHSIVQSKIDLLKTQIDLA